MSQGNRPIRFGIMCKGMILPEWQAIAINKLLAEKDIQLHLLILDARIATAGKGKRSIRHTLKKVKPRTLFWQLFNHFYVKRRSRSNRPNNLTKQFKEIPRIYCLVKKKGQYSEYFSDQDVSTINSYKLDFILRFGFGIIRGDILKAARFGIWSFHHDDMSRYRGTPPCFWEIYHGDQITGSVLQRLAHKLDAGTVLKEGYLRTKISYINNRDQLFFESAKWPLQLCVDIRNNQLDGLADNPLNTVAPIYSAPSNLQMVKFFFNSLKLLFKRAYKSLFFTDYWNVGVAEAPIEAFLEDHTKLKVNWYPGLPKNKFIADPFGICYKGEFHIIYEEFFFHERIGKLAAFRYDQQQLVDNGTVINEPFHMSYPFLFEHKNEIYCIPETYQANQVRLYKAKKFPYEWTLVKVLIDNYAGIDNTLLRQNGHWWLFSTDKNDGVHHNLQLFFADDLFGVWKPHPKNPVKTDIRSARPAGTIFHHNNEWFRPAMDYSEKVEGRIKLNKIQTLTPTDYSEETCHTINPFPDNYFSDKIHTLSQIGPYTMIDGAKELFVFSNFHALKFKIISKLKKLIP